MRFFAFLVLIFSCLSAHSAQPEILRTPGTTNAFMNAPSSGTVPFWNATANKWSNAIPSAATATNAQPPSTILTNLSGTGAATNVQTEAFTLSSGYIHPTRNITLNTNAAQYVRRASVTNLEVAQRISRGFDRLDLEGLGINSYPGYYDGVFFRREWGHTNSSAQSASGQTNFFTIANRMTQRFSSPMQRGLDGVDFDGASRIDFNLPTNIPAFTMAIEFRGNTNLAVGANAGMAACISDSLGQAGSMIGFLAFDTVSWLSRTNGVDRANQYFYTNNSEVVWVRPPDGHTHILTAGASNSFMNGFYRHGQSFSSTTTNIGAESRTILSVGGELNGVLLYRGSVAQVHIFVGNLSSNQMNAVADAMDNWSRYKKVLLIGSDSTSAQGAFTSGMTDAPFNSWATYMLPNQNISNDWLIINLAVPQWQSPFLMQRYNTMIYPYRPGNNGFEEAVLYCGFGINEVVTGGYTGVQLFNTNLAFLGRAAGDGMKTWIQTIPTNMYTAGVPHAMDYNNLIMTNKYRFNFFSDWRDVVIETNSTYTTDGVHHNTATKLRLAEYNAGVFNRRNYSTIITNGGDKSVGFVEQWAFDPADASVSYNPSTKRATIDIIAAGGGGGGAGSMPFNSSQFDTNATVDIISGAILTNLQVVGTLSLTNGTTPGLVTLNATNATGFVSFTVDKDWLARSTNQFNITNAAAGHVLKVSSISGGIYTWTNGPVPGGTSLAVQYNNSGIMAGFDTNVLYIEPNGGGIEYANAGAQEILIAPTRVVVNSLNDLQIGGNGRTNAAFSATAFAPLAHGYNSGTAAIPWATNFNFAVLASNRVDTPVVTNVTAMKWNIWTNYVQTVSNFVFSFHTNYYELKNQTNVVFTNLVEEVTAVGADMKVHIHNTTGVTMGLVWPAYGAQHGYFFQTNANNAILTTTSLAAGQHGVASFSAFGTNIFATFTTWP